MKKIYSKLDTVLIVTITLLIVLNCCSISFVQDNKNDQLNENSKINQKLSSDIQNNNEESIISDDIDDAQGSGSQTVIQNVPAYIGYHGCGPTAAAIVLGYYDGNGYPDIVDGDASIQTSEVNAMISSQENWDDYCLPLDFYPGPILADKSENPPGDEHEDNCIADFMKTSQSAYDNYYGWSWFSDVGNAMKNYVNWAAPQYTLSTTSLKYTGSSSGLTWNKFCAEINANRPVVLLVDTQGDNIADHFVTGIGYDDNHYYACYNDLDSNIHWYDFSKIVYGNPMGIYGAVFSTINSLGPQLAYSPSSYNFGIKYVGEIAFTTLEIWNSGIDTLNYDLSESCNWVELTQTSGTSNGEHDQIVISIDTTSLSIGNHNCDIQISSDSGTGIFTISVNVTSETESYDQQQIAYNNKKGAYSNNWIAQSFKPSDDLLTKVEVYIYKWGNPTSDIVLSIRSSLSELDLAVCSKPISQIPTTITWITFDFNDISVTPENTYYIILRTTSGDNFNAYEWGYGYYTSYTRGSFWKSSNSGSSWIEYTYYDFCFKTYTTSESSYSPDIPNVPSGPTILTIGQSATYTTSTTDPDGDQVQYRFYWGDGTFSSWTSLVNSGQSSSMSTAWNSIGTYVVKAQARDSYGSISGWSTGLTVVVGQSSNNAPNTPNTPTGPTTLNTGQTGTYTTSATDPDNDQVQYRFDWGDGEISTWTNLVNSGTTASKTHSWTNTGTYQIKTQAKDEHGSTSSWSTGLVVIITASSEQLDQQQTQYDNKFKAYSYNWVAQSFKPALDTLTKIDLYIDKTGSPTTDIIVSIRNSLTGPDLAVCSKSVNQIPSTITWITFDFNDIIVTPENTYYIILRTTSGDNFNAYEWGIGYYTAYTQGSFWKSSNTGSSWNEYTYYDFCFKTYGI